MSTATLPLDVLTELEGQSIELPSWAFGNSGTRFRVFPTTADGIEAAVLKFNLQNQQRIASAGALFSFHNQGTMKSLFRPAPVFF